MYPSNHSQINQSMLSKRIKNRKRLQENQGRRLRKIWIEREFLRRWPYVYYFCCIRLCEYNTLRCGARKVFVYQDTGQGWKWFYWFTRLPRSRIILGWASRRMHLSPQRLDAKTDVIPPLIFTKKRNKKQVKPEDVLCKKCQWFQSGLWNRIKNSWIPVQHIKYWLQMGRIPTRAALCCWSDSQLSCFWDGLYVVWQWMGPNKCFATRV